MSCGINIGVVPREELCHVPPGWFEVHIKICETCGFNFFSRGDKNCRRCHANPVPLGRDVTVGILEDLMHSEHPIPQ